ncbi:MAG: hypothetical protein H6Q86_5936 [candidate division NC10 bacterium]|nr:hypothetical protein [candidate division NC10 bacterium]
MILRYGSGIRTSRRIGVVALVLIAGCVFPLAGALSAWAAGSGTSECVACHTDSAKLKALTPPDPPPTEEGEG